VRGQHLGDQPPDPAEADDHHRGPRPGPMAAEIDVGLHVDPPRRDLAELGEQRRERQADRGDDLPEGRGLGRISCAAAAAASTIRVVSDGEAISTPPRPRRSCAPDSRSSRGDHRLDQQHADHREQDALPIAATRARSTLMPTVIRKMPSARPRKGAVITSTSLVIIGLGDQDAGEQRAHDRRQADGGGGEAGDDHDQQAGGQEQLRALGPRRLREQRGSRKRPSTSIAAITARRAAACSSAAEAAALRIAAPSRRAAKMIGTIARSSNSSMAERRAADRAGRADQRQHERGRGQGKRQAERDGAGQPCPNR
jgi:hypothetical protein